MATMKLVPSTSAVSNSSYVTVTSASNMYADTSSTTYATLQNTRNSTNNTYYVYVRGFNFSSLPSDAIVSSFTIRIRGYETNMSTSSSYRPSLCNNTTNISNSTTSASFSTSANTLTFSIPSSLTWDTITGYGANFGVRIPLRRANTNSASYVYVYGIEIEVTYTVPVYYDVTISNSTTATVSASDTHPLAGDTVEIRSNTLTGITIKDNNADVTSQFTQRQDAGTTSSVTNVTSTYGFALNANDYYESNNKAHASSAAVCRVDFYVPVAATVTFSLINYAEATYDYGQLSNIDTTLTTNASADTSNVHWDGKNNNSASVQTVTYTNVSAGSHYIYVKYFKDQYTDSNNDSLQFKYTITLTEPYTPSTYYGYDITNIQANHTIVVTSSGSTATLSYKSNGSWVAASKAYKKISGSWVEQTNLSNVFDSNTNYVKG